MLTANECYEKIMKKYPGSRLTGCLEFKNFFLFSLIPPWFSGENYLTGTTFDAVDKRNGKMFEYDITSDIEAYHNANKIEIETIYNLEI